MSNWTQQERDAAIAMRRLGASSREIGQQLGRSAAAVRTMLSQAGHAICRSDWIAGFSAREPLEDCPEHRKLIRNAIEGSAKLRDAILRCAA
jgi:IS30 family transposase